MTVSQCLIAANRYCILPQGHFGGGSSLETTSAVRVAELVKMHSVCRPSASQPHKGQSKLTPSAGISPIDLYHKQFIRSATLPRTQPQVYRSPRQRSPALQACPDRRPRWSDTSPSAPPPRVPAPPTPGDLLGVDTSSSPPLPNPSPRAPQPSQAPGILQAARVARLPAPSRHAAFSSGDRSSGLGASGSAGTGIGSGDTSCRGERMELGAVGSHFGNSRAGLESVSRPTRGHSSLRRYVK
jgi:hypothetical protein